MSDSTHPRDSRRAAAFLLIIPGSAAIGFGIGLALASPAAGLIIGIGAGALIWGLIVALRG
jgi:hypothetical protein